MSAEITGTLEYSYGVRRRAYSQAIRWAESLRARLEAINPPDVIEWIEKNITTEKDSSSAYQGYITLSEYQKAPIRAQLVGDVDVVICWPEQFGKSFSWKCPLVYKAKYMPAPRAIVYEEKDKAAEIHAKTVEPLFLAVPYFEKMHKENPGRWLKGRMKLSEGWIEYTGAGVDLTSNAYRDVVLDEYDTYPLTLPKKRSQLANARKRCRTFRSQYGLGCLVVCSSIKGEFEVSAEIEGANVSPTWMEYKKTNMNQWHLLCLGCNKLTIPSTSHVFEWLPVQKRYTARYIDCLRWEKDEKGIIPDSVFLHCPECGHKHEQNDLKMMNASENQYIPLNKRVKKRLGFMTGGLAESRALKWAEFAQYKEEFDRSTDYEVKRTIANSFFGIPFEAGYRSTEMDEALESHCTDYPEAEQIDYILAGFDTQSSPFGWYYTTRGYDESNNSFLLDHGFLRVSNNGKTDYNGTVAKLEDYIRSFEYHGKNIDFSIIDQGGHHTRIVKQVTKSNRNVYQYKGSSISDNFKLSDNEKQIRLIHANAKRAASRLCFLIYKQNERHANYWNLPPYQDLRDAYINHILNIDPDSADENKPLEKKQRIDYFACEKMTMVLNEVVRDRAIKRRSKIKSKRLNRKKRNI